MRVVCQIIGIWLKVSDFRAAIQSLCMKEKHVPTMDYRIIGFSSFRYIPWLSCERINFVSHFNNPDVELCSIRYNEPASFNLPLIAQTKLIITAKWNVNSGREPGEKSKDWSISERKEYATVISVIKVAIPNNETRRFICIAPSLLD